MKHEDIRRRLRVQFCVNSSQTWRHKLLQFFLVIKEKPTTQLPEFLDNTSSDMFPREVFFCFVFLIYAVNVDIFMFNQGGQT